MRLDPDLATAYTDRAFDLMLGVLDRFGDDQLDVRPPGPDTMAAASLVLHCVGVSEFWLGHVALGRPSERDREAELSATATRDELVAAIGAARTQAAADLAALAGGAGQPSELRAFLLGDGDDDSLVLHVLEELYQHLGHLDLTADALDGR